MKLALFVGTLVLMGVVVVAGAAGFAYASTHQKTVINQQPKLIPESKQAIVNTCVANSGQLWLGITSTNDIVLGCLFPKSIQGIEL